MIVDLSEIQNAINEEDKEDESESADMDPTREDLRKSLFRKNKKAKEILYKASVDVSGTKELKKGIINWFFNSELNLFAVKRFDEL